MQHQRSKTTSGWRTLSLVLAGIMIGGALVGPVSAAVSLDRDDRRFVRKTARKIANKKAKNRMNALENKLQPQINANAAGVAKNTTDIANRHTKGEANSLFQGKAMWALIETDGTIAAQSGGITCVSCATSLKFVKFPTSVSGRAIIATSQWNGGTGHTATVNLCGGTPEGIHCGPPGTNTKEHVLVETYDAAGAGASNGFYIVVLP